MIQRVTHTTVFVADQERAKRFYTEKLGFEVRSDELTGPFRWLTVGPKGQPDFELILMAVVPSPMMDEATVATVQALLAKGVFGAGIFATADCRRTFDELTAKGVEFMQPPTERHYGIEALLKDDSGNWFSMCERKR